MVRYSTEEQSTASFINSYRMSTSISSSVEDFNTTFSFTIPLFAFRLPSSSSFSVEALDVATTLALGFLLMLTSLLVVGVPLLGWYRLGRRSETAGGQLIDLLQRIHDSLDGPHCVRRTVCEVWTESYKFGRLTPKLQSLYSWPRRAVPVKLLYSGVHFLPKDQEHQHMNGLPAVRHPHGAAEDDPLTCRERHPCDLSMMDVLLYLSRLLRISRSN